MKMFIKSVFGVTRRNILQSGKFRQSLGIHKKKISKNRDDGKHGMEDNTCRQTMFDVHENEIVTSQKKIWFLIFYYTVFIHSLEAPRIRLAVKFFVLSFLIINLSISVTDRYQAIHNTFMVIISQTCHNSQIVYIYILCM